MTIQAPPQTRHWWQPDAAHTMPPASSRRMNRRLNLLIVGTALAATTFAGRLIQLQVVEAPELAEQALSGRLATTSLPAHRGQIMDRNGVVLATSADRYTVAGDQLAILGYRSNGAVDEAGNPIPDGALGIAQLLAPLLGQRKNELAAQLNGERRYAVLAKDVDPLTQREIRERGLQAYVSTELTSDRVYPAGSLAGPLVGYVNEAQVGQGGIERTYDELLYGTPGTELYERGRDGVPIPGGLRSATQAASGGDVILTIDQDIQWKAEDAINKAVRRSGARYGYIVVKDIKTGDLLALADSGEVDPNDRSTAAVAEGSRAVQDTFEPGSTGKVITMAAALETNAWQPDSRFVVPFRYTAPNGQSFRDSHSHAVQNLTLTGILVTSSNSGTVQVAQEIPPEVHYEYFKKFHLGESTGLELPGEARGIVHPWEKWDGRTRYTVAFGQGLTVNAIQATNIYSTVANNGVYTPARIVAGTRAADAMEVVPTPPSESEQVISPQTAQTLMRMLEQVTSDDGTAKLAQIEGYRVAGKTGTAEVWEDGGRKTFMASFIGVAPAEDPQYVVSVFLKSPSSSIYGGTVAAPVFREVMSFALTKYGVPPSEEAGEELPLFW